MDVTRGIAALAVVLWHWQHFAFEGYALSARFDREAQPGYAILKVFYETGERGVDYFFVLSGFIFFWLFQDSIRAGRTTWRAFALQRFSRLYPLHFVALIGVALLQRLYVANHETYFIYQFNDAYHFLLHLGFASHWGFQVDHSFNAPVWSVSIEVLLYLVFFVAARTGRSGPLTSLAISVVSFFLYMAWYDHYIFRGLANYFLGGVVFHLVAALSRQTARQMLTRAPVYAVCVASWLLVVGNYHVMDVSRSLASLGLVGRIVLSGFTYYVLLASTVCAVALLEIDRGRLLARISWMGDVTYASYLLHFPLQIIVASLVSYGWVPADFWRRPTSLVVFFGVLVVGARLTFRYFERPAQNWIRSRLRMSRPVST